MPNRIIRQHMVDFKKLLVILSLCFASMAFSSMAIADDKSYWLQVNGDIAGQSGIQLKMLDRSVDRSTGYTLDLHRYSTTDGFFNSIVDRVTDSPIDSHINTVSVLKLWAINSRFSYLDFGVGLGVANGEWAVNCSDERSTFLGSVADCDIEERTRLGIPLQVSAALGRYIGVGLFASTFITEESKPRFSLGLSVPIGNFHRD